jgi:hypothetical protein
MTMFFTYLIVREDGRAEQALARGSLYTSDVESAKRHAQATCIRHRGKARVGGNPTG